MRGTLPRVKRPAVGTLLASLAIGLGVGAAASTVLVVLFADDVVVKDQVVTPFGRSFEVERTAPGWAWTVAAAVGLLAGGAAWWGLRRERRTTKS